jgi:hypothetical protein
MKASPEAVQARIVELRTQLIGVRHSITEESARLAADPNNTDLDERVAYLMGREGALTKALAAARVQLQEARAAAYAGDADELVAAAQKELEALAKPAAGIDAAMEALRDAVAAYVKQAEAAEVRARIAWRHVRPMIGQRPEEVPREVVTLGLAPEAAAAGAIGEHLSAWSSVSESLLKIHGNRPRRSDIPRVADAVTRHVGCVRRALERAQASAKARVQKDDERTALEKREERIFGTAA